MRGEEKRLMRGRAEEERVRGKKNISSSFSTYSPENVILVDVMSFNKFFTSQSV